MGVVVEATQLDLDRRVALKFLRTAVLPEKGGALTRFEREARTVAKLRGSHIVQIYDVGKLDHGEPFIVMELLIGEDLSAVLDREQRLPLATAVDYVLQTCEAMAEAHVAGVIHRDLKPANLFVTTSADGRPLLKVLDFGISKLLSETTSLNLTSGALGSPLYMSPEQLSSAKDLDHRTDIWSLGAILYELLTGSPAFEADGLPQVCARIMLGAADPIRKHQPDVPLEVESAIMHCFRRYPDERLLSVADLAAALLPFARKSSQISAEAAIRIVQGSALPHGPLPRLLDSLAPPPGATQVSPTLGSDKTFFSGPPSSVAREQRDRAPSLGEYTVNVSGAPPSATQGELKPLVSAVGDAAASTGSMSSAKPLWFVGLGVAGTTAIVIGVLLARPRQNDLAPASAQPPTSSAPVPLAPSSVPSAVTPAADAAPGAATAPTSNEPAPAPSSGKPAQSPPRAVGGRAKPRVKASAGPEPSSEDLLNHR